MDYCPDCFTVLKRIEQDPENSTYSRGLYCTICREYKLEDELWQPTNSKWYKWISWAIVGIVALGIIKAFIL
jgi:hypothetical protein